MLSKEFKEYAISHYSPSSADDGALLMALALGTLPESDTAGLPQAVPESFVRHGLFLREHSPFCRDIPEDIFLHYVFYPRVNSEELTDCRPFFYEKLAPLVEGLEGVEAALAVNRWCAAQMTYESTDERTLGPLAAYSCGLGRCGEESVFAVTAFRSAGIPARQIYVPWWTHCDDNHAWVEVYAEGAWHFLGACEPEPILDRGWFTSAASRAMAACSRSFFDYGLTDEAIINREGQCIHYNQIARYADTVTVTVTVLDGGRPVCGAALRFGVMNMADFGEIARLETDENGRASLETGLGSLLVEAQSENKYAFAHIRTDTARAFSLELQAGVPEPGEISLELLSPVAGTKTRTTLTASQQQEKNTVLARAKRLREARIGGYFLPEYASAPEEMQNILHTAGGNAGALWEFYRTHGPAAMELLLTLAPKDYRDAKPEILETFLGMEQGPRIGFEVLRAWRQPILNCLTPARQDAFRADPGALWRWIRETFREEGHRFYETLWLPPDAALRLGAADEKGRRLLFVAVCRTLGVPARLDPTDGTAQVWTGAAFATVETQTKQPMASLTVSPALPYFQSWSLARWEGHWHSLDLTRGGPRYLLPTGRYRLITSNRLPNGNQLAHIKIFSLSRDTALSLPLRQASPDQMLAHYPVPLSPCGLQLRLYLEVGAEPTEHALNELLEAKALPVPVALMVRSTPQLEDPTLQKVLRTVPGVQAQVTDFEDGTVEALARAMYQEPGVWPLLVLTDGVTGYYGHCGYGVNTVPLALRLAENIGSREA